MTESSTAEDALSIRSEMIQRRGVLPPAGISRPGSTLGFPFSSSRLCDLGNLGDTLLYLLGGSWWTLTQSKVVKSSRTWICGNLAEVWPGI